jgi:hypothetical protein
MAPTATTTTTTTAAMMMTTTTSVDHVWLCEESGCEQDDLVVESGHNATVTLSDDDDGVPPVLRRRLQLHGSLLIDARHRPTSPLEQTASVVSYAPEIDAIVDASNVTVLVADCFEASDAVLFVAPYRIGNQLKVLLVNYTLTPVECTRTPPPTPISGEVSTVAVEDAPAWLWPVVGGIVAALCLCVVAPLLCWAHRQFRGDEPAPAANNDDDAYGVPLAAAAPRDERVPIDISVASHDYESHLAPLAFGDDAVPSPATSRFDSIVFDDHATPTNEDLYGSARIASEFDSARL